ncbi:MAG: hypothetical protein AVDCRST_MAG64-1757, partial [uncultured Phycisphaerae bacterium]
GDGTVANPPRRERGEHRRVEGPRLRPDRERRRAGRADRAAARQVRPGRVRVRRQPVPTDRANRGGDRRGDGPVVHDGRAGEGVGRPRHDRGPCVSRRDDRRAGRAAEGLPSGAGGAEAGGRVARRPDRGADPARLGGDAEHGRCVLVRRGQLLPAVAARHLRL